MYINTGAESLRQLTQRLREKGAALFKNIDENSFKWPIHTADWVELEGGWPLFEASHELGKKLLPSGADANINNYRNACRYCQ